MKLLISAGPTYEPLDAVRFLGNRSSGRLGVALADYAADIGIHVTLLLGPNTVLPTNPNIQLIRFRSTEDLQLELDEHFPNCDCLVMAAAVADFRPKGTVDPESKLKRSEDSFTLELESTPDLLARCASKATETQLLVGFALEPAERLAVSAEAKLARKDIDLIVANELSTMDADTINATLIGNHARGLNIRESTETNMPKSAFARWLLDHLIPIAQSRISDTESTPNGEF